MRVYGYFILPDGSAVLNEPLTGAISTVAASNKRFAELAMPYIDDEDILAEVNVEDRRILFVRDSLLKKGGMNLHLFIGTDTSTPIEVVGIPTGTTGYHQMALTFYWLRHCHSKQAFIAVKKSPRIDGMRLKKEIEQAYLSNGAMKRLGPAKVYMAPSFLKHGWARLDQLEEVA